MKKVCEAVSTVFYSGYLPFMPGTVGTFVALLLVLPLLWCNSILPLVAITIIVTLLGFVAVHVFLDGKTQDLQHIVIDEASGLYITILIPMLLIKSLSVNIPVWLVYVLSFVFFRVFDITKPSFIGYIDKNLHGTIGIMMDDIVAGIFAGCLISMFVLAYNYI